MLEGPLSWIEIDAAALQRNIVRFREMIGPQRQLGVVVKANAYGHGLLPVAQTAVKAAHWLMVFDVQEAFALRDAGIEAPILVFGPTPPAALGRAAAQHIRVTVASPDVIPAIVQTPTEPALLVHLKLETGTYRQGLLPPDFNALEDLVAAPHVAIEGAYTHFADIEDTTDHTYAREQLSAYNAGIAELEARDADPALRHTACSAATLLFDETHFNLARVGISAYGLWPSKETLVSVKQSGREPVDLEPVMSWKTRITEVKAVPAGKTVGYGRTFKTTRPSRLAVLPVGYANGYSRALSNQAHVLVHGQRAKVAGRVMMNMVVVDVTDIPEAAFGDEVVLLGTQGDETVSAEMLAEWGDTINYEVVTRAEPHGPRVVV